VILAAALVGAVGDFVLAAHRRWSGTGKWLLREIQSLDHDSRASYAASLTSALRAAASGDRRPLHDLAVAVLDDSRGPSLRRLPPGGTDGRWRVNRDQLTRRWPQFALHIALEGAHLQAPTDTDLSLRARRAAEPNAILPAVHSHFVTWIQDRTADELAHQVIVRGLSNRDLTKRPGWTLDLAVMVSGQPVGMQSLSGFDSWPHRRIIGTTSWLLDPFQRRGLGTRSRAAILELAFSHLHVESAKSWVLEDNHASCLVSTTLGYVLVDRHDITDHGRHYTEHVYQIDRDKWLHSRVRRQYAPVITHAHSLTELLALQREPRGT